MLFMTSLHVAVIFLAAILLIAAALNDAHKYKIPNIICAALLILFPIYVATAPRSIEWDQHLMVFGLMLISGFAMFLGNLAGAGDIKLMAVTGLWAGPHLIAVFLIMTAIAGGIVALTMAVLTYIRNNTRKQAVTLSKVPIPYGVAIAVGGLSTLYLLSQPLLLPG